jgi:phosphate:Na+ symporter
MTFSQSIGIIMGANIGTTITAFIVGFDLFQYASFFLIIGAFCLLFSNHPKIKGLAQILFGLGCLFYGLELMSMHLEAITKLPEFMKLVTLFTNHPILAMLGGAITTALIQSSSAVIAIVQQMYHLKAISLYVSIPYILGCNIGTTITAFLSALKTNSSAKKAAFFHFLFNVIGTTFFMIFLTPFYHFFLTFRFYIPISPRLQLAFIHGFFNIVTTLLIFPFYKHIITLIESCFKKNC